MTQPKTVDGKVLEILRDCPEARYNDMLLYLLKYPLEELYQEWLGTDVDYMDLLGGLLGIVTMCCLQINRLNNDMNRMEVNENEKTNR